MQPTPGQGVRPPRSQFRRKQIFTAGELHAVEGDRSKLVATATAILVPAG